MITLSEQNLKELETFINEIPTKYGKPLLEFFAKLYQEQQPTETRTSGEDTLKGL
jgi:hypothetical protein